MPTPITIRPLTAADGPAWAALDARSADGGRFQIAPLHHVDPWVALQALDPGAVGFVATAAGRPGLVGVGLVSFAERMVNGVLRPAAELHGLQVHPEYRRRGIGRRLLDARLGVIGERLGEDAFIHATIQEGNTASMALSRRWRKQLVGPIVRGVCPMRRRPPRRQDRYHVRPARESEMGLIAERLNAFYDRHHLWTPRTAQTLSAWVARSPLSPTHRHLFVVEDRAGNLCAGAALTEQFRVMEMQVQHLPLPVRLLNHAVRFVPKNGRLRQLGIGTFWYAKDGSDTASHLWNDLRWSFANCGNGITYQYSAPSSLQEILKSPLWFPTSHAMIAVNVGLKGDGFSIWPR